VQPRCGIWIVGGVRLQGLGSHLKLSCPVCLTVITRGDSSKIPQTYWGYLGISGDMVADILMNWSLTQESLAGFTRKNPRWTFVPRNHPDITMAPVEWDLSGFNDCCTGSVQSDQNLTRLKI